MNKPPVRTRTRTRSVPAAAEPAASDSTPPPSPPEPTSAAKPPSRKKRATKVAKKQPTGDYEHGYCRAPKHGQFPNEHQNRKGRPPKSKNVSTLLDNALDKQVKVLENGRERTLTRRELFIEQLANSAVKMKPKAVDTVIKHMGGLGGGSEAPAAEERTHLLPHEDEVFQDFLAMALEAERIRKEGTR